MIILDTECYHAYFLILMKDTDTGKVRYFETFPGNPKNEENRGLVAKVMNKYTTVSFNGLSYDLPLITAMIEGFDNKALKSFSNKIIGSKLPSWSICRDNQIQIPKRWDHIDLIEVAPGVASLKVYGGRMNFPKMQDLPITPDTVITPEMHEPLRTYCLNDVETTEALYHKLKPQIDLRISMSDQYGIDLRSKSDAQIAEAVIKSELEKKTGKKYYKTKLRDGYVVRYQDPGIVSFDDPELKQVFDLVLNHKFELQGNGSIKLPKEIKSMPITISNARYSMGVGGLHSQEKSQLIQVKGDEILSDFDVASYYPNIILQQRLSPRLMGKDFLELYQSIVERRLAAKQKMQEIGKEITRLEKELDLLEK